ncbi:MAG TPA: hypothetical protein VK923_14065 [Euzebyales bacterium]|nr:hypothetical protein [Euzebyales bacterium]
MRSLLPASGPRRILLCDEHAAGLADDDRLTDVTRLYDATVEDPR